MIRNPNCSHCQLHESATYNRCVWGKGDPNADLMLIGEAPGFKEDVEGEPFVGEAGQLLDHILWKLKLNPGTLYITNCFKCRPPNNKLPARTKGLTECWQECRPYLEGEINRVKPKVIVLLGNTPLSLVGDKSHISKWEGSELHVLLGFGPKVRMFACLHPAAALRNPALEHKIATALYVAAKAAGLKPKPVGMEAGMYPYEIRS